MEVYNGKINLANNMEEYQKSNQAERVPKTHLFISTLEEAVEKQSKINANYLEMLLKLSSDTYFTFAKEKDFIIKETSHHSDAIPQETKLGYFERIDKLSIRLKEEQKQAVIIL